MWDNIPLKLHPKIKFLRVFNFEITFLRYN